MSTRVFAGTPVALGVIVSLGACSATWQRSAPDFVPVVRIASAAIVGIADDSGVIGSGFRARPSQLFVTAAHVVAAPHGALRLRWQGKDYPSTLLSQDAATDVAVRKQTMAGMA